MSGRALNSHPPPSPVEIAMRIVTVLAATALLGSTVVQAQQPPQPGSIQPTQTAPSPAPGKAQDQLGVQASPDRGAEPHQRSAPEDDVSARVATRLAQFKEALRLTPDQEKNWPAFDAGLREFARLLEQSADRDQSPRTHVERLRRNAERLGTMSAALTRLADVEEPLYKSLDDGQKERFARLARQVRRDVVELRQNRRTDASDEDRSRYGRDDESGRHAGDGRDDDDRSSDRRGMGRGHMMMQDDDDGWRGHHRRMGRGMMDDDDGHMRRGRMNDEYDRRSDRGRDRDDWYERRSDRRDDRDDRYDRRGSRDMMMSDRMGGMRGHHWRHDCEAHHDRRSDRDDDRDDHRDDDRD